MTEVKKTWATMTEKEKKEFWEEIERLNKIMDKLESTAKKLKW